MNICYTAIFGNGYDILKEPRWINKDWLFICFTDQDIKSKNWHILKVDSNELSKVKQARQKKILFPNYKANHFLWIDANIEVVGNLNTFLELHNKADINIMKHPHRINIQKECKAILKYKKDSQSIVQWQLMKYEQEGYISNELAATGILLRTKNITTQLQAQLWFDEVKQHSHRDQMSFNYACYKAKIQPNYFSYDLIDSQFFKYHLHPHKQKK